MYDLHTHSLLSDGQLLPSEIARRYEEKGYKIIAITDHCDYSNISYISASILEFCRHWPRNAGIKVLPGVELTHIPLDQFKPLAAYARKKGMRIIIGHGESPVEPVRAATNREAILSGINILAHPGEISEEDVILAKEKKVFLELTSRSGHSQGNRHVAKQGLKIGADLIIDSDSHSPEDIISLGDFKKVALDAGLSDSDISRIYAVEEKFLERLI